MADIQVKQESSNSIKFSQVLEAGADQRVDLYFSLPQDLGINPKSLNEEDYHHSAVLGRRSYFSQGLHLPLVQGRFTSFKKQSLEDYRIYLNLFAYQFAVAIETDSKELARLSDPELFYPSLQEQLGLLAAMLKKFRRSSPADPKWQSYFENADNYLSWFCEQAILKLLSHSPRTSEFAECKELALAFCREESSYREVNRYNSAQTVNDPNRISNKMLLLRRLLQQGVVLKQEQRSLGKGLKKLTTGVATALVMMVVYSMVFQAQGMLSGLTMALVVVLAIIYGFREIFKDDIRDAIWRRIQRGRPRWSRILRDTVSQSVIAKQRIWLDFVTSKDMPDTVKEILQRRHSQNKVESETLHYAVHAKVSKTGFLAGYHRIQESINFNLVPFLRHLERSNIKVYREQDGNVSSDSAERRYQINVVVSLRKGKQAPSYARYKLTVNRSGIVELTQSSLPENILAINSELEAPDSH
ncbi:hypothetical protein FJQ87_16200 [Shewanella sp. SNU WT4]|uniref:hypothetical protein n=1 Tax=Shewanella sp. SNU WT4 TaxID=2590015 RepID=UPI001129EF4B|nr:hypothetical protein [Shewanella sp. SNU WT4]QDF67995.1 hypothetical protein FJQ87_16200 [Shewanella sp. SNU WT4]